MSETSGDSRDAIHFITNLINNTVSSAKQLLDALEREGKQKAPAGNKVIMQSEAPPGPSANTGQSHLRDCYPLLGARISCEMYRSLDKKRILITQLYEAEQEINDDVAKQLEQCAQTSSKRCVIGGTDFVRV
ncbi:hypothetical protein RB195_010370 [Necator americanus]|uniref:Uncharacterized protein n=1 Tax=Necator americanus TaxID=51031 RepID=A0ABR1CXM2_NECAM